MFKNTIINLQSNKAIIFNVLWAFLITQSITVPFFIHHNLNFEQIFMIQTIQMSVWLIIDIPSSYLSKFFHARNIIMFATVLRFIGAIGFFFSNNFIEFILTYIVIGLGNGLSSGINISILYNEQNTIWEVNQRTIQINYLSTRIASIISLVLGAFLAVYSLKIVAMLNIVTAALPMFLLMTMHHNIFGIKCKNFNKLLILNLLKNSRYIFLIIVFCFYNGFLNWTLYFNQLSFLKSGNSIMYYGVIIGIIQVIFLIYNILGKLLTQNIRLHIIIVSISSCFAFLLCSTHEIIFLIFGFFINEFVRFIINTSMLNAINHNVLNDIRGIVNSIVVFGTLLFTIIFSSLLSKLISLLSWEIMSIYIMNILMIVTACVVLYSTFFLKEIQNK